MQFIFSITHHDIELQKITYLFLSPSFFIFNFPKKIFLVRRSFPWRYYLFLLSFYQKIIMKFPCSLLIIFYPLYELRSMFKRYLYIKNILMQIINIYIYIFNFNKNFYKPLKAIMFHQQYSKFTFILFYLGIIFYNKTLFLMGIILLLYFIKPSKFLAK